MTISDALHRLLLDNLTTATILLNAELRLEYMNPAAEMLLAISGQRSHGQFISELFTESTEALNSLRQAVARSLGIRPGARLAVVTVISPSASSSTDAQRSETTLHRQHRSRLKQWAQPLDLHGHGVSYHVLEATDVAQALVRYAEGNNVGLMILGAATHGLQMQRLVATVPMRVARDAPCTVILVKQHLPFAALNAHDNVVA